MDFINIIMAIVNYIQELVAYFRAVNDGKKDAKMPDFSEVLAKVKGE